MVQLRAFVGCKYGSWCSIYLNNDLCSFYSIRKTKNFFPGILSLRNDLLDYYICILYPSNMQNDSHFTQVETQRMNSFLEYTGIAIHFSSRSDAHRWIEIVYVPSAYMSKYNNLNLNLKNKKTDKFGSKLRQSTWNYYNITDNCLVPFTSQRFYFIRFSEIKLEKKNCSKIWNQDLTKDFNS